MHHSLVFRIMTRFALWQCYTNYLVLLTALYNHWWRCCASFCGQQTAHHQFFFVFFTCTHTETVEEGKRRAREALRQRLNLTGWNDKVMVGVVSRLTPQKGVQLIKHAAYKTLDRGGQFVLLGGCVCGVTLCCGGTDTTYITCVAWV